MNIFSIVILIIDDNFKNHLYLDILIKIFDKKRLTE
jgi:hypothetical protein